MMIWFVFAGLALATVAVTAWPLLRNRADTAPDRTAYDITVYQDQLREVDADLDRGLLTAAQAEAARTEIKRRMLAVADAGDKRRAKGGGGGGRLAAALAVALVVPVGTVIVYSDLGRPGLPDQPFASRDIPSDGLQEQMHQMAELVDGLAERLKETPDDAEGWMMLARSAKALDRYGQAADAYRRAIALGVRDPNFLAGFGETLIFANQGEIVPEAINAFEDTLRADPTDPRARFYLGMAQAQSGDMRGAIAIWRDLEREAPADAAWVAGLRERIAEAAAEAGIDPASVEPKPPQLAEGGGTAAPPGMAGTTADQQAMIQGMIDGLAARLKESPNDPEGWAKLGRAYRVQQKYDLAEQAYAKAIELKPSDVDLKLAYADVLLAKVPGGGDELPAEFVEVLREVLALDADNRDALYYLGVAEAQAGRKAEARALWTRLRDQLPENSPERAGMQQQIDSLGS